MSFLKKYTYTLIWFIIMCYLLFSPSDGLPKGGLIKIPHLDKIVHFAMFGILSTLFLWDLFKNDQKLNKPLNLLITFSIIFAGISEWIQYSFIYGREGDTYDFIADILGMITGILFWFIVAQPILKKVCKNKKSGMKASFFIF